MRHEQTDPASEVKRLQRCVNDLVSVLALPSVWSGSEPHRILETFLDALLVMLDLDFLYTRVWPEPHEAPIDVFKTAHRYETSHSEEIRQALNQWSGEAPQRWSEQIFRHLREREVSVFPIRMGIEGELGLIVAGSQRPGFPEQTESLVLGVAANQVAIGLQQALLLNQQKRVASELDRRVAQRTAELAAANEELRTEISERKEIEKRLRESEVLLKKSEAILWRVIDTIPTLAWAMMPDGPNEFLSKRWHEYTGLSSERSRGWGWQAAFHPEDLPSLMVRWQELLTAGEPGEIEARIRRHDGEYRWFLIRTAPFRNENGAIVRWYGTSTDIDDRKVAEEALRASETNLRQIVDSIPGLVCTMDAAGEIEQLNRPLLEYFGKTPGELKSWKMTDAVHPDDLPEVVKALTYSITTGTPYAFEHRCRRADGVYRWFQVRALAVHDKGDNIRGWYVLLTDIDDRKRVEDEIKRSEEGFRVVVETASDAVVSIDENGAIIRANPATKRIFGYSPEELIGKPLTVLMPGAMRGLHETGFKQYLESGVKHLNWQGTEMTALRANGEEFPAEVSFGEMAADRRKIFTGFIRDISEKKRSEEELRNTQAELARMTRVMTVGQLTASIAHEVSQPLSGIITNASTCLRMLKSDPPNIDGARETVQRTIRDGNRASEVITRLRTLFSKKQIDVELVDLNEAAREVVALLSSELQRNNVILKSEFSDRLPTVNGDRVQLQQVILNLLRNASDAMIAVDDRPRQLLIRTEMDGNQVTVSVQDSGVGFDPEVADQLFESFFTTKREGMGIGLSVSRSIVEAHHGRLWAVRNPGAGATFVFSIPQDVENLLHPKE